MLIKIGDFLRLSWNLNRIFKSPPWIQPPIIVFDVESSTSAEFLKLRDRAKSDKCHDISKSCGRVMTKLGGFELVRWQEQGNSVLVQIQPINGIQNVNRSVWQRWAHFRVLFYLVLFCQVSLEVIFHLFVCLSTRFQSKPLSSPCFIIVMHYPFDSFSFWSHELRYLQDSPARGVLWTWGFVTISLVLWPSTVVMETSHLSSRAIHQCVCRPSDGRWHLTFIKRCCSLACFLQVTWHTCWGTCCIAADLSSRTSGKFGLQKVVGDKQEPTMRAFCMNVWTNVEYHVGILSIQIHIRITALIRILHVNVTQRQLWYTLMCHRSQFEWT